MSNQNIAGTLGGWGYGWVEVFQNNKGGYPLFTQYADEIQPTYLNEYGLPLRLIHALLKIS